jgi:hypothetical protein
MRAISACDGDLLAICDTSYFVLAAFGYTGGLAAFARACVGVGCALRAGLGGGHWVLLVLGCKAENRDDSKLLNAVSFVYVNTKSL